MPLDMAQTWRNKACNLHVVCITGMFHRPSVEHKLTHHGTAVNVPRECSTNRQYISAWLIISSLVMYHHTHRMIQTDALNGRMASRMAKRTRTHEQCSHEQHGGAGAATGDDDHTAIHKQARQKMPKGGRPTIGELRWISALVGCVTKLLTCGIVCVVLR